MPKRLPAITWKNPSVTYSSGTSEFEPVHYQGVSSSFQKPHMPANPIAHPSGRKIAADHSAPFLKGLVPIRERYICERGDSLIYFLGGVPDHEQTYQA
jgi:hypothetical protein